MRKNKSDKISKVDIDTESINIDPSVKQLNADDTRPLEKKNMPRGAFKPNKGSK